MTPKKNHVQFAIDCGAMDHVNKLLSAAYLLQTIAMTMYLEAEDTLEAVGLQIGSTKHFAEKLNESYVNYVNDFLPLIEAQGEETKRRFFGDYDDTIYLLQAHFEIGDWSMPPEYQELYETIVMPLLKKNKNAQVPEKNRMGHQRQRRNDLSLAKKARKNNK